MYYTTKLQFIKCNFSGIVFVVWFDIFRGALNYLGLGLQFKSPMKWGIVYGTKVPTPGKGGSFVVLGDMERGEQSQKNYR
jgi:hypothetical protein